MLCLRPDDYESVLSLSLSLCEEEVEEEERSSSFSPYQCAAPSEIAGLEQKIMKMKESGKIEGEVVGTTEVGEVQEKRETAYEAVRRLGSSNAVVVFSISGCCMCHVVKQLLFGLGVGPTIVELDKEKYGFEMQSVLYQLAGGQHSVPAVFVGGKFLGGIETLMASHINGTLVPLLKAAGALWL